MQARRPEAAIGQIDVRAAVVPTQSVESDGTLEWDRTVIERLLFEGAPEPHRGALAPDPSRPGLGLELKEEAWKTHEATV